MKHASIGARELPVFYISSRPEAYEVVGEVDHEQAIRLAHMIADHARRRFPKVDFRIDEQWHDHGPALYTAANYIESHWQTWARKECPTAV